MHKKKYQPLYAKRIALWIKKTIAKKILYHDRSGYQMNQRKKKIKKNNAEIQARYIN